MWNLALKNICVEAVCCVSLSRGLYQTSTKYIDLNGISLHEKL